MSATLAESFGRWLDRSTWPKHPERRAAAHLVAKRLVAVAGRDLPATGDTEGWIVLERALVRRHGSCGRALTNGVRLVKSYAARHRSKTKPTPQAISELGRQLAGLPPSCERPSARSSPAPWRTGRAAWASTTL